MQRPGAFSLVLLALALAALGCQAPPAPTGPTFQVVRSADYETLFDATLSVLRVNDFTPLRADRQRGEVLTHPATSAQWFEFWRGDSPGGFAKLESSLHTTRRYVRVKIEPAVPDAAGAVGGVNAEFAEPGSSRFAASSEYSGPSGAVSDSHSTAQRGTRSGSTGAASDAQPAGHSDASDATSVVPNAGQSSTPTAGQYGTSANASGQQSTAPGADVLVIDATAQLADRSAVQDAAGAPAVTDIPAAAGRPVDGAHSSVTNLAAADATGPRDYIVTIEVQKERYSAPERQVTTASGALSIYNERLPTTDGLRKARTPGESWVPQGRDAELERWLLERAVRMFEERRNQPA